MPRPSRPGQIAPTREQFDAFELMFAHFNRSLFDGSLPPVILNFSRKPHTHGFFAPLRWARGSDLRHEISLNPASLNRAPAAVASTLAHEMVHLWQHTNGKPSRTGYHNREWADHMDSIGLIPSSTGAPGGARVGQRVTHYIAPGGRFELAFQALGGIALPWSCDEPADATKTRTAAKNKIKYSCPSCEANVWGKPELSIVCGECDEHFRPEE
jgi:predicted SprT family Zn-dependent metalloprotease